MIYSKAELRKICRDKSDEKSPKYYEESGRKICEFILKTKEWKIAQTVFIYVSLPTEADTKGLLKNALDSGKRVCVPKIIGKGIMKAVEIRSTSDLKSGMFGISEPDDGCRTVSTDEIDFIILPCFAAGEDGARLGKGGGYYDRFCAHSEAPKFVLCPEIFLFGRDKIPTEKWDVKVDFVVTEKRIIKAEETL